jgi:hypothetical protein
MYCTSRNPVAESPTSSSHEEAWRLWAAAAVALHVGLGRLHQEKRNRISMQLAAGKCDLLGRTGVYQGKRAVLLKYGSIASGPLLPLQQSLRRCMAKVRNNSVVTFGKPY